MSKVASINIVGKSIASLSFARCLQRHGISFKLYNSSTTTGQITLPACDHPTLSRDEEKGLASAASSPTLSLNGTLSLFPPTLNLLAEILGVANDSHVRKSLLRQRYPEAENQQSSQAKSQPRRYNFKHPCDIHDLGDVWTTTNAVENVLEETLEILPSPEAVPPFTKAGPKEDGLPLPSDQLGNAARKVFTVLGTLTNQSVPFDRSAGSELTPHTQRLPYISIYGIVNLDPEDYEHFILDHQVGKYGYIRGGFESSNHKGKLDFRLWREIEVDDYVRGELAGTSSRARVLDLSEPNRLARLNWRYSYYSQNPEFDALYAAADQNLPLSKEVLRTVKEDLGCLLRWKEPAIIRHGQLPKQVIRDLGSRTAPRVSLARSFIVSQSDSNRLAEAYNIASIGPACHSLPIVDPTVFSDLEISSQLLDGQCLAECVASNGPTSDTIKYFYDLSYHRWQREQRHAHQLLLPWFRKAQRARTSSEEVTKERNPGTLSNQIFKVPPENSREKEAKRPIRLLDPATTEWLNLSRKDEQPPTHNHVTRKSPDSQRKTDKKPSPVRRVSPSDDQPLPVRRTTTALPISAAAQEAHRLRSWGQKKATKRHEQARSPPSSSLERILDTAEPSGPTQQARVDIRTLDSERHRGTIRPVTAPDQRSPLTFQPAAVAPTGETDSALFNTFAHSTSHLTSNDGGDDSGTAKEGNSSEPSSDPANAAPPQAGSGSASAVLSRGQSDETAIDNSRRIRAHLARREWRVMTGRLETAPLGSRKESMAVREEILQELATEEEAGDAVQGREAGGQRRAVDHLDIYQEP